MRKFPKNLLIKIPPDQFTNKYIDLFFRARVVGAGTARGGQNRSRG